jgi:hypothetical protein
LLLQSFQEEDSMPKATEKINDVANHFKAPIRRETDAERIARRRMELPNYRVIRMVFRHAKGGKAYPSDVVIPGKAVFVKEPLQ